MPATLNSKCNAAWHAQDGDADGNLCVRALRCHQATWARSIRVPALAGTCVCRMNKTRSSLPALDARGPRIPCSRRSIRTRPWACTRSRCVRTPGTSEVRLCGRQLASLCQSRCSESLQSHCAPRAQMPHYRASELRLVELPELMHGAGAGCLRPTRLRARIEAIHPTCRRPRCRS